MRATTILLLAVVCSARAFAQSADGGVDVADAGVTEDAGTAASATDAGVPLTFLLAGLEANKSAAEYSAGLAQSIAQRLAAAGLDVKTQDDVARVLGVARQQQLAGCTEDSQACMLELGNALGSGYVISGRVDRLGDRYLLNLTVLDLREGAPAMKSHREVEGASELPHAADQIADEIAAHFGFAPRSQPFFSPVDGYGFNLALGLGSELITSIARLAPSLNLELGYRVTKSWAAFLQISAAFTFGSQSEQATIIPGLLGVRYYFRETKSLQPTVGAGLGLLSTIDSLQGKARPSLVLMGGLWWFIVDPIGVGLEANVDVLGLAFEFADTNKSGVNVGLSLAVMYRF